MMEEHCILRMNHHFLVGSRAVDNFCYLFDNILLEHRPVDGNKKEVTRLVLQLTETEFCHSSQSNEYVYPSSCCCACGYRCLGH